MVLVLVVPLAGCRDEAGDAAMDEPAPGSGSGSDSGGDSSSSDAEASTGGDDEATGTAGPIDGRIDGHACPPDHNLTATNFGLPFLLTWCAGCHSSQLSEDERAGAPPGVDLDTIEGAHEQLLRIYDRSVDDDATMPPAGGPTAEERALLADWLACGAPE
ncbi:MAG: hypothetical protein AAF721_05300 [Myxococcota bacterium]